MKKHAVLWPVLGLFCLFGLSASVRASHIVGGEINYRWLSGISYEIKLSIYRDCAPLNAPYDPVAWIGIFDSNNQVLDTLEIPHPGSDTIELSINSECANVPQGICYEVAYYIDTIDLPPRPGGYQFVYQRCCWNATVTNIKNPDPQGDGGGSVGITVYASMPNAADVGQNSNPAFKNLTDPFACLLTDFEFDHSAVDAEGDSLVYKLFTPFDGKSRGRFRVDFPYLLHIRRLNTQGFTVFPIRSVVHH